VVSLRLAAAAKNLGLEQPGVIDILESLPSFAVDLGWGDRGRSREAKVIEACNWSSMYLTLHIKIMLVELQPHEIEGPRGSRVSKQPFHSSTFHSFCMTRRLPSGAAAIAISDTTPEDCLSLSSRRRAESQKDFGVAEWEFAFGVAILYAEV